MVEDPKREIRERALRLLARREYGKRELRGRLMAKGGDAATTDGVIAELASRGLVSDRRFTEALVRSRRERGYGPVRIRTELQAKGIDPALIEESVDERDPEWLAVLSGARAKKFGDAAPADYREWVRQARFLQGRGFTAEQIRTAIQFEGS